MAAYRRVYDSRHLQADCQEPGSALEPYARKSSMGYLFYLFSPLCCTGLILIHRFPPSLLLFHNHHSLPIPIHGYHLQTLLTLPWLPYTSSVPPLFHPLLFPSSPSPPFSLHSPTPLYAYNMPMQLSHRHVLRYIQLYGLCYPRRRHAYTAATHDAIIIVSSCYVIATGAPLSC